MTNKNKYPEKDLGADGRTRPGERKDPAKYLNLRIFPCPTCKRPNQLTGRNVLMDFECDFCAGDAEFPY